jgi:hypothetical protein
LIEQYTIQQKETKEQIILEHPGSKKKSKISERLYPPARAIHFQTASFRRELK